MRNTVYEMNEVNPRTGLTVVKSMRIDTTDSNEARKFAQEYARENSLQIVDLHKALHKWYTGYIGFSVDFAEN